MRKLVSTMILPLAFLYAAGLAQAQTPAGGEKIGVINIQDAISSTAEGKKAFADLQKKYSPRQADLQRQQQTLSDAERIRLSRELSDKQKLFDRAREDAQADFQQDRQDVITRIGQKMVQIIEDYSKQNGYALVLDAQIPIYAGNQTSDATIPIYFASKEVDIRDEIVKRYDAAFPVEGATAPAAPAAKPPAKPQK